MPKFGVGRGLPGVYIKGLNGGRIDIKVQNNNPPSIIIKGTKIGLPIVDLNIRRA